MKKSLILGINGQDGILLSKTLISQGFEVYGIGTSNRPSEYLERSVKYIQANIRNTEKILEVVHSCNVQYLYNLAGRSSVSESFKSPEESFEVNFHAVERMLRSIYKETSHNRVRFFQASSSEMFGKVEVEPQDEDSPFNPQSPYAEAKLRAHLLCSELRKAGHFISCGILFNHESVYRPTHFVSRKITSGIARIKLGLQKDIPLGNLDSARDWGAAKDYVIAMQKVIEFSSAEDFVIATGISHTVKELVEVALSRVGMLSRFEELILIDQQLVRPVELRKTLGNPKKISMMLGWDAKTRFEDLINEMVDHDLLLTKSIN